MVATEVKRSPKRPTLPGIAALLSEFPVRKKILIGPEEISLEKFLSSPVELWVG